MNISISKILRVLFFLTLFFIPFDGEGILPLGEFSSEAFIFFLLLFLGISFLKKILKPMAIPFRKREAQLLLVFMVVLLFCSLINFSSILENYHPQRTGLYKLFSQFFVLLFFFPITVFFLYDFFKNEGISVLILIRKAFLCSLGIVFLVGFLEVLYVFYRVPATSYLLDLINKVPLIKIVKNTWDLRTSSLTKEPPSLGMFLITVLPWILIFKPKKYKLLTYILPLAAILFLIFYSGSRSGLFIILLQFIIYIIIKNSHKISIKRFKNLIITGILLIMMLPFGMILLKDSSVIQSKIESFKFIENYDENTSNKTRLGTYIASLETIKKNPFFGVGFGQAGFYVLKDYPEWAVKDNPEIERYRNGERFPPMFNIYLRLLTETGIIGLGAFLFILVFMLYKSVYAYYYGNSKFRNHQLLFILSIIGFTMTWIQFDTFRVLGFWIFFSFYLYIQDLIQSDNKSLCLKN